MSNQVLLWTMFIVPWLSLFFMKKDDIRRYMPAGLFSSFLLVILQEAGVANDWWYFQETIYPLLGVFTPFTESVDVIIPMWVLKYTYGRFGYYFLIEIAGNIAFFFLLLPWFADRGIMSWPAYAGIIAFSFSTVINLAVYRFHMWQEGVCDYSKKTEATMVLRPAASKLMPNESENKDDKK
ncbi:MAG: hypothetical protein H6Q72_3383 [Firmicutes bacterium]|nr:hypothetical protein [Bacillota bacterium]